MKSPPAPSGDPSWPPGPGGPGPTTFSPPASVDRPRWTSGQTLAFVAALGITGVVILCDGLIGLVMAMASDGCTSQPSRACEAGVMRGVAVATVGQLFVVALVVVVATRRRWTPWARAGAVLACSLVSVGVLVVGIVVAQAAVDAAR
jgi:hypothetical protein